MSVQIVLVLVILVKLLGWIAVGAGVGLLLCAIPLASLNTWGLSTVRVRLLACTDARVKLISEVISHACLPQSPNMLATSGHMTSCACMLQ